MAARLINPEDVAKACSELIEAGEQVTTLKVHKILGKGSYGTIQKFINQWKNSDEAQYAEANNLPAVADLPQEFEESGQLLLKKIFHLAEQQHATAVEKIRAECDHQVNTAIEEVKEAVGYAEEIGATNETLDEELKNALNKINELDEKIGSLKSTIENQESKIKQFEKTEIEQKELINKQQIKISEIEKNLALSEQAAINANDSLIKSKNDYQQDIEKLTAAHAEEIQTKISECKTASEKEIKNIIAVNDKATATLITANEKEIKNIIEANDKATKSLVAAHDKAIKALESKKEKSSKSSSK